MAGPPDSTLEVIDRASADPSRRRRLIESLSRLVQMVLEANRRMNLTADDDPRLFWPRHVEDALLAARRVEEAVGAPGRDGRLLDVGSGAGVPGLVLALLWPQTRVELLESRGNKCRFLERTARALGLTNVTVHHGRAEQFGRSPSRREQYDLVTARALAAMPVLAELTLPLARVGGWVVAMKSADLGPELAAAAEAVDRLGGAPQPLLMPYERSCGKRCVVCLIRKSKPTPAKYPRRAGVPARRPIGKHAARQSKTDRPQPQSRR